MCRSAELRAETVRCLSLAVGRPCGAVTKPFRGLTGLGRAGAATAENASHRFLFNVQPEDSGEFADGTSYDWTFDGQWHCAEWHVDGADQGGGCSTRGPDGNLRSR
jgi:hypothetical protein